ncbi:hypothetical protein CLV30_101138 [Haloactinopolyspora alba]|uniref:Uncharacterized protein n=1 Tax=Haloactinopolyspora alba TaxID=648780 RepID=A0A2P8EFF4_9ACTN|nr:hypothetical protein [Haloactinopolyspora alba]PSL08171.1 hypothetical protein CLV30_101138 [Haloactinopolyspora alba]
MTTRIDNYGDEIDIMITSRDEVIDVAVDELTQLARDRYLTAAGERPFDFADDLATILGQLSTNVGDPAELFGGQDITTNVEHVAGLIGADLP